MDATTTKATEVPGSLSTVADPAEGAASAGSNEELIEEELLVEEVSIDGMCGVY